MGTVAGSTLPVAPASRDAGPGLARLGAVSYLNTLPLIAGLEKLSGCELRLAPPARLIDLLLDGAIDLGLVSLIDYQRSPVPLVLVPSGMIGCDGPTLTVRLFSRVPPAQLVEVHVDRESHTSVALLRVLLAERHDARPRMVEFDAAGSAPENWPDAVLLIGDKVVRSAPPQSSHPHQLDLGEEWKALTGLPFVYAVWMCREDRASDLAVTTGAALLDRQRRHNAMRLDWIIHRHAKEHGWPEELARRYLAGLLRFEVGEREAACVDRFFALASKHGLIERPRPARWLP